MTTAPSRHGGDSEPGTPDRIIKKELKRVRRLQAKGKFKEAEATVEALMVTHGRQAQLLCALGVIYRLQRRYEDAFVYIDSAFTMKQSNTEIARAYLDILWMNSDYVTAVQVYDKLPDKLKTSRRILFEMYYVYLSVGWPARAARIRKAAGVPPPRSITDRLSNLYQKLTQRIRGLLEDAEEKAFLRAEELALSKQLAPSTSFVLLQVRIEISNFLIAIVRSVVRMDMVERWGRILFPILSAIATAITVGIWTGQAETKLLRWPSYGLAIMGALISTCIFLVSRRIFNMHNRRSGLIRIVPLLSAVLTSGIVLCRSESDKGSWIWTLGYGLVAGPLTVAVAAICDFTGALFSAYIKERIRRKHARAVILLLLDDLHSDIKDTAKRADPAHRASWVQQLESIAHLTPYAIVPCHDTHTNEWLKKRALGAGESVRQMKKSIVAPSEESWNHLARRLRHQYMAFSTANWGKMLYKEPQTSAPRNRRAVIVSVARTTIVAALPAISIFTLSPILNFDASAWQWAKIVALAWAIISILFAVDPAFREKVETARGIASSLNEASDRHKHETGEPQKS